MQACGWVSSKRLDLVDGSWPTRLCERKRRYVEVSPSSVSGRWGRYLGKTPSFGAWRYKYWEVAFTGLNLLLDYAGSRRAPFANKECCKGQKGWLTSRQSTFLTSSLLRLTGSCFPRLPRHQRNATTDK
jgi:hypothetical protein